MDKVELLAYDRWRMGQLRSMRGKLSDKDVMLGVETVLLALAGL